MEALSCKYLSGAASGLLALLVPVRGLVLCAVVFVAVDFVTGVVAGRRRARRDGREWRFSSRRAWDTVTKLIFVMAGIVLAWILDSVVLTFVELHLARIFTGFVCGVEFWSYLENAADISGHPVFHALKRLLKKKVDGATGGRDDDGNGNGGDDDGCGGGKDLSRRDPR